MRAALSRAAAAALALTAAAVARAGAPLALVERQAVTLEFDRPVARVAVTDPDLVSVDPAGARLRVKALRAGRGTLEVAFDDGASVSFDVAVDAARRPGARAPGLPPPNELELGVGAERRLPAAGVARVFVEENGVARARVEGQQVLVTGVAPGTAAVVVVDADGVRTTWTVRVR